MINKIQLFIILGIILIVAAFLRLYLLENNYNYYGDSARDLLEIHNWFISGQIPLKGPITSMGTFHLGPFYYYLLAPFVLIFQNDPISTVYFEVIDGLLLIAVGFIFLYKLVNFSTAFIFSLIVTLAPFTILLSRGSWNPHPQLLVFLLIIFSFMQFIKTNCFKYIFLLFLLLGIGVQLHYTFLANFFSLILLLFLFKRDVILNYKTWLLCLLGLSLPLLPFLIGQTLVDFTDINMALNYISQSESKERFISFKSIQDRLTYPFAILFPSDNLSWLLKFLSPYFYLFILGNVTLIAFLKTRLSLLTKVVLVLFFSNIAQGILIKTPFYSHYHYSTILLTLILISIYISYLYNYAKIKLLWLPVLTVFILWEILLIPNVYKTPRTPVVVSKISKVILSEYRSQPKDPSVGIFVMSPITSTFGFEYRYLLEKEGIKTFSSSRSATADYVIIEQSWNDQMSLQLQENNRRVKLIKDLKFDNGGTKVNFAKVYKIERAN